MRLTVQFTSSPTRPEYSLKTVSRSASRTFWKITCLAVCAEMRPSASVFFGIRISPPISASGSMRRASRQSHFVSRIGHRFDDLLHGVELDGAGLRSMSAT